MRVVVDHPAIELTVDGIRATVGLEAEMISFASGTVQMRFHVHLRTNPARTASGIVGVKAGARIDYLAVAAAAVRSVLGDGCPPDGDGRALAEPMRFDGNQGLGAESDGDPSGYGSAKPFSHRWNREGAALVRAPNARPQSCVRSAAGLRNGKVSVRRIDRSRSGWVHAGRDPR
jgi:hypothetical protein